MFKRVYGQLRGLCGYGLRNWWVCCLFALGAMFGNWCVSNAFAVLNSGPCRWTYSAPVGNDVQWQTIYQEYYCLNGVETLGRSATINVQRGSVPCTGNINGIYIVWSTGATVSGACANMGGGFTISWIGMGEIPWGFDATTGLGTNGGTCDCSGTPACGGTCYYTAVALPDGTTRWQLSAGECTPGAQNCNCPAYPVAGNCPAAGATTSVACGSPNAGPCTPVCEGNCNYISVPDGLGGFVWSLTTNGCTAGANNCSCPSSPGGNCPNAEGLLTSIACGAPGGPCNKVPCSGTCSYTSVADGDKFKWQSVSNNCTAGADNCGCPAEPGGDCPTELRQNRSVACGTTTTPCKPVVNCSARGGDADNDGCCADVDIDDTNSAVCASECTGTCRRCWTVDPDNAGALIACDPTDPKYADGSCRCANMPNADRDKDGCCDCVDDWPDDAKKGCECCDFNKAWRDGGGGKFQEQWNRVFGSGGSQWIRWNPYATSPGGGQGMYEYIGPNGTPPSYFTVTIPLSAMSQGAVSNRDMKIPMTTAGAEAWINTVSPVDVSGSLAGWDTFRLWFRVGCIYFGGVLLVTIILQEVRV